MSQGSISCTFDKLLSMADASFLTRHNGGSAAIYEAEDAGIKKRIHKPHLLNRIYLDRFYSLGKRMSICFE